MEYVLFDVETTGLSSHDEIIQFAALVFEDSFDSLKGIEDFYCMSTARISAGAMKVHGITPGKLIKWSDKKFFEDQFRTFYDTLGKDVTWVCYSNTLFDLRMINQTLKHANLDELEFGNRVYDFSSTSGAHHLDLMGYASQKLRGNARPLKLQNALKMLDGFDQDEMNAAYVNLNTAVDQIRPVNRELEKMYHNARYDTFAMWYLLNKLPR